MDEQLENIISSTEYITPLSSYISGRIIEYDIKSANITMLRKYHLIDDNLYNYLSILPKQDREVYVGKLIANNMKTYIYIKAGIIESKKALIDANSVTAPEIIRVANDAIYINRPNPLQYTKFGDVEFKIKSENHVCLIIDKLFITFNNINGLDIDVKGLGDAKVLHQNTMLSFIATVINTVEMAGIDDAIRLVSDFYTKYIKRELPLEFYREFDSKSFFRLKYVSSINSYLVSDSTGLTVDDLDINYNGQFIRNLWSILFQKKKLG